MSSTSTLSEKIVLAVGTGRDPTEIDQLESSNTLLSGITADAAEINVTDGATAANSGTTKALITGTSGALTVAGALAASAAVTVGTTLGVTGATTFTGGILNAPVIIPDATPYTVLAANSGKVHIISEQTSSITLNLPVIATGLYYKFIMGGVATEAQNWVIVGTTPSFWNGGVAWTDLNDAESNLAVVYGNGSSHLTLTVTTPAAGTCIEVYANATPEWVVYGTVISDSTPAFT